MKEKIHVHAYLLGGTKNDFRSRFPFFAVSATCHFIFFMILVFSPVSKPDRKFSPSVINVDLVASVQKEKKPDAAPSTPAKSEKSKTETPKTSVKKPPLKEIKKAAPVPEKAVSLDPQKTKIKKSLKKKTFKSSEVVKSAIKRIEKQSEESRPKPIEEAIASLKQKVGKTEAIERLKEKVAGEAGRQGKGVAAGSEAGGKDVLKLADIYRLEIAYQIQKNWAFSEQLAGRGADLHVSLVFRVMPSGEIRDVWFTDRSGNSYLDDSAYKAVMKSNPVDPHPAGLSLPYVEVGLRFGPEGIN
jgi:colicin import membrane protein